jgi:hypothetical protein
MSSTGHQLTQSLDATEAGWRGRHETNHNRMLPNLVSRIMAEDGVIWDCNKLLPSGEENALILGRMFNDRQMALLIRYVDNLVVDDQIERLRSNGFGVERATEMDEGDPRGWNHSDYRDRVNSSAHILMVFLPDSFNLR